VVLDAASVPATNTPLTLAPAPPNAAPGAALQLANGTTIVLSGQLTGASPQRADVAGTTVVQLALGFLPPEFAAANCSCVFLNTSLVAELERSAEQARPCRSQERSRCTPSFALRRRFVLCCAVLLACRPAHTG